MMTPPDRLAAYLAHLRLDIAPSVDAAGLARVQQAHRLAIAFENLDVRLGRPIRIDSEAVFAKLVTRRRGGYCFEQNRLFGDMLAALGFSNRPLLARVWLGLPPDADTPPRTHVLLLINLNGEPWIADAGFGGSYVPPLPLADGAAATTGDGARHRLRKVGAAGDLAGEWLLERAGPATTTDGRAARHDDWQAQYSFDLSSVAQADLDQCNHWTSTRPATRFTTMHIVGVPLPDGFATLTERTLRITRNGEASERDLATPEAYRAALADTFGLMMSEAETNALPLFASA